MSQSCTTPSLFQTSLRRWQADWKARHEGADGPSAPTAAARRVIGAAKTRRRAGQAQAR